MIDEFRVQHVQRDEQPRVIWRFMKRLFIFFLTQYLFMDYTTNLELLHICKMLMVISFLSINFLGKILLG